MRDCTLFCEADIDYVSTGMVVQGLNPVTLTAARVALDALSRENVKRNRGTRCGIMSPYSPQVFTPGEAF
jgi:hypothetical protein